MEVVKNSVGRTICRADANDKVVEIKSKDVITTICFLEDGTIKVTNKMA